MVGKMVVMTVKDGDGGDVRWAATTRVVLVMVGKMVGIMVNDGDGDSKDDDGCRSRLRAWLRRPLSIHGFSHTYVVGCYPRCLKRRRQCKCLATGTTCVALRRFVDMCVAAPSAVGALRVPARENLGVDSSFSPQACGIVGVTISRWQTREGGAKLATLG